MSGDHNVCERLTYEAQAAQAAQAHSAGERSIGEDQDKEGNQVDRDETGGEQQ